MNSTSFEFNRQLELDVLISGMSEVTVKYTGYFDWQNFDEIVIPKGVTRIGDWAFRGCNNLTYITIPEGVTRIGYCAFISCNELTDLTIPNSVTSIGDSAFAYCSSLTSLTIPNSVTSIGRGAFAWCGSLTDIVFEGKTLDEVKAMKDYPWDISPEKIHVQVIPDLL